MGSTEDGAVGSIVVVVVGITVVVNVVVEKLLLCR